MESSIAEFLLRWAACELPPTEAWKDAVHPEFKTDPELCQQPQNKIACYHTTGRRMEAFIPSRPFGYDQV